MHGRVTTFLVGETISVTAVCGSVWYEHSGETDSAVRGEQINRRFGLSNFFQPAVQFDPFCRTVKAVRRVFSNWLHY